MTNQTKIARAVERVEQQRQRDLQRVFGLGTRRLVLDVEITKSLYELYSTGEQYVGGRDLVKPGGINAMSWGWFDSDEIEVASIYKGSEDSYESMIYRAHDLMEEAETLIGHNFRNYDRPKLNEAFVKLGLTIPEYEIVDTLMLTRRAFGKVLPSGAALKDVTKHFGIGEPVDRYNLLYEDLEAGKPGSVQRLYDYSRHDIVLTKALYEFIVKAVTGELP